MGSGSFVRAPGHTSASKGMHVNAPSSGETSNLIQNLTVQSGGRYVSTVWVKLDDPAHDADVVLSFRFRDKDAWYVGKGARQKSVAAQIGDWQELTLVTIVPHGATGVSVMLGVSNTAATLDDVQVYQMSK